MALFGKADANLPILTRFYQVERPVDNLNSLFRMDGPPFVQHQTWANAYFGTEMYRFVANEKRIDATDRLNAEAVYGAARIYPWEYVSLHAKVVEVMDALADDATVRLGFLEALLYTIGNRAFSAFSLPVNEQAEIVGEGEGEWETVATSSTHLGLRDFDRSTQVPLRTARLDIYRQPDEDPKKSILFELTNLFLASDREFSRVDRCAECQNPFIVQRKGNTFCSHRCADRAGTRRRSKHKKGVIELW